MKRNYKILIPLFALLLSFPLFSLWALINSELALTYLVSHLPVNFGAISNLQIIGVSGTIRGGFFVQRFSLDHELFSVRAQNISSKIRVLPLLWQTVDTQDFKVQALELILHKRINPPPKISFNFLPAFLTIEAYPLQVDRLLIKLITGGTLEFSKITASTTLRSKNIQIKKIQAARGAVLFTGRGLLTAAMPMKLSGEVTTYYAPKQGPHWRLENKIQGNIERLSLRGGLREPFIADLGQTEIRIPGRLQILGQTYIKDLDLRIFGANNFFGNITGTLDFIIDSNGYRARGSLLPHALNAGPIELDFDGIYKQGALQAKRINLIHPNSGFRINTTGRIAIQNSQPQLSLLGNWINFRWPLTGTLATLRSPKGSFSLNNTWPFSLDAQAELRSGDLPSLQATIKSTLHRDHLDITQGKIALLQGQGTFIAQAYWKNYPHWQISTDLRGINPAGYRSNLPGSLDLLLEARGTGLSAQGPLELSINNLSGTLRGVPAHGSGSLNKSAGLLVLKNINLTAGGTQLLLNGSLYSRESNLKFELNTTDLGVWIPGASGILNAIGSVQGSQNFPVLKLKASASRLALKDFNIGSISADIDFDTSSLGGEYSQILLNAKNITLFKRTLNELNFQLNGEPNKQIFSLQAHGPNINFIGHGAGIISNKNWLLSFNKINLGISKNLLLQISKPLELKISGSFNFSLAPFCMQNAASKICGAGEWDDAGWSSQLQLEEIPLSTILNQPSPRVSYDGNVSLNANLWAKADKIIYGTIRAKLNQANLLWQRADGINEISPIGSGALNIASMANGITAELQLTESNVSKISASLNAVRTNNNWTSLPLQGSLSANSTALSLIHLYIPEIDHAAGILSSEMTFSGTLGTPQINGFLRIANGELDLYRIKLGLREIAAEANLIDNSIKFDLSARAGTGRMSADAAVLWRERQPYGELNLKGSNLLLIDAPEARVIASPDLHFRISGRRLEANGTVLIPEANLNPADLVGAALISSDELVFGEEIPDPKNTFIVSSNIHFTLGERVALDTLGLSGKLEGSLNVHTSPDGASRAAGELSVNAGEYIALGRRLDIERGRLIFAGGLITDPSIDIRATKEFPEVKAGVNVRGTLREPRMTFFAEPSLTQGQIVSLMLAGGSLESSMMADSRATNASTAGRRALIAQGGAILAQQLGTKIGIRDVGIEQSLSNQTSLVLGKYLTPRIYVSYGISLTEALNSFKLRYTLSDRWTLKSEAGKAASADIIYTIEKK